MGKGISAVLAVLVLAGCAEPNPEAGTGAGFDNYVDYALEQSRQEQGAPGSFDPGLVISDEELGAESAATDELVELGGAGSAAEPIIPSNPDISDEQNFEAVSERQTIESDRERLERISEQYTVIEPEPLPERRGERPNIVAYALASAHPVGQAQYRRRGLNAEARAERNCARYFSPDLAQEAFLAEGGPERDRLGLDPDGDGYACDWDPAPFRKVRG